MPDYQQLTNEEIMSLASQRGDLTDEARLALDCEQRSRNITPQTISSYAAETVRMKQAEALNIGIPRTHRGIGRRFFGKNNYQLDSQFAFEEFDTTLWFVLFWFPLVPLGTYRVRRKRRRSWWRGILGEDDLSVIHKLRRNWEQIFLTWIEAVLITFAILLILPWLLELGRR